MFLFQINNITTILSFVKQIPQIDDYKKAGIDLIPNTKEEILELVTEQFQKVTNFLKKKNPKLQHLSLLFYFFHDQKMTIYLYRY